MRKKFYRLTALALYSSPPSGGLRQPDGRKDRDHRRPRPRQRPKRQRNRRKANQRRTEKRKLRKAARQLEKDENAPELPGLTYESTMELTYAECFDVYNYEGGYSLIDVHDSARYLVVPDGKEAPEGLDPDIIVLQKPLNKIYLAATSAMAIV